jgi:hypothetical protein
MPLLLRQIVSSTAARLPQLAAEGDWRGLHRALQLLVWLLQKEPGSSAKLASGRNTAALLGERARTLAALAAGAVCASATRPERRVPPARGAPSPQRAAR